MARTRSDMKPPENLILRLDRHSLCFVPDLTPDRMRGCWDAHFSGGVIHLVHYPGHSAAIFATTSGAVIAQSDNVAEPQEALDSLWDKVSVKVDRFRLLMRLATES